MSVELKAKLVEALINFGIYILPSLVVATLGALAYAMPKVFAKLREVSPFEVLDKVLLHMEEIAATVTSSLMDEANKIKNDPSLNAEQKRLALQALKEKAAQDIVKHVKAMIPSAIPSEALLQYARQLIERVLVWVKRDFSTGNSPDGQK